MQKTASVVVSLALGLAGCAANRSGPEFDAASCDQHISVQVIGGKLNIQPERACIKNKNTKVIWALVEKQKGLYVFRPDSVTILGDAYNDFPTCNAKVHARNGEVEDEGSRLKCDDVNSQPGEYDYILRVYFPNGGEAATSDPSVWNN
jgi:hypothetical protein